MKPLIYLIFLLISLRPLLAEDVSEGSPEKDYFQKTGNRIFNRYHKVTPHREVDPMKLQDIIKEENMKSLAKTGRLWLPYGTLMFFITLAASLAFRHELVQLIGNLLWPISAGTALAGGVMMWGAERWAVIGAIFSWALGVFLLGMLVWKLRTKSLSHLFKKSGDSEISTSEEA